jgi:hypothetical protein
MVDLGLVERYRSVRVADVVDALDRYGFYGRLLISREIRPLYPGIKGLVSLLPFRRGGFKGKFHL